MTKKELVQKIRAKKKEKRIKTLVELQLHLTKIEPEPGVLISYCKIQYWCNPACPIVPQYTPEKIREIEENPILQKDLTNNAKEMLRDCKKLYNFLDILKPLAKY